MNSCFDILTRLGVVAAGVTLGGTRQIVGRRVRRKRRRRPRLGRRARGCCRRRTVGFCGLLGRPGVVSYGRAAFAFGCVARLGIDRLQHRLAGWAALRRLTCEEGLNLVEGLLGEISIPELTARGLLECVQPASQFGVLQIGDRVADHLIVEQEAQAIITEHPGGHNVERVDLDRLARRPASKRQHESRYSARLQLVGGHGPRDLVVEVVVAQVCRGLGPRSSGRLPSDFELIRRLHPQQRRHLCTFDAADEKLHVRQLLGVPPHGMVLGIDRAELDLHRKRLGNIVHAEPFHRGVQPGGRGILSFELEAIQDALRTADESPDWTGRVAEQHWCALHKELVQGALLLSIELFKSLGRDLTRPAERPFPAKDGQIEGPGEAHELLVIDPFLLEIAKHAEGREPPQRIELVVLPAERADLVEEWPRDGVKHVGATHLGLHHLKRLIRQRSNDACEPEEPGVHQQLRRRHDRGVGRQVDHRAVLA